MTGKIKKHPKDIKNSEKGAKDVFSLIEKGCSKMLELGTGQGEFFLEAKKKGFKIIGLDIIPNKELLRKGFDVRKHDLNEKLPFKKSSFDVVIGLAVLEHLFNPYNMMKEIKRVLKPGGYAMISMPNTSSVFQRIGQLYEKRLDNLNIYWHHYQPNINSIRNLVSKELRIEKEIFSLSFRRLRFLGFLKNFLLKISKKVFCASLLIKARKEIKNITK